MSGRVEIEIANDLGKCYYLPPLSRRLRGRVDFAAFRQKPERNLVDQWPEPIPGEVVGFDVDAKTAYIREPLHDAEHTAARERILSRGMAIPAEREEVNLDALCPGDMKAQGFHPVTTWVHHMRRAVEGGHARVVQGELPPAGKLPGKPRISFLRTPQRDPAADSSSRLADVLEKLLDRLK